MSHKFECYSRRGQRISFPEWSRLLENNSYRFIHISFFNNAQLTTIWFGLINKDTSTDKNIFETTLHSLKHFEMMRSWRTPSEDVAKTVHAIVRKQLIDNVQYDQVDIGNPFN